MAADNRHPPAGGTKSYRGNVFPTLSVSRILDSNRDVCERSQIFN